MPTYMYHVGFNCNTPLIFPLIYFSFRTYGDCEFRPGPHLNVLLGPNGMCVSAE